MKLDTLNEDSFSDIIPPLEGVDFVFVNDGAELGPNPCIRLLKAPYKDIVAKYGLVRIAPDELPPRLEFKYAVLSLAGHKLDDLNKDSHFHKLLGDIIVEVQIEALDQWKEKNYENRDNPLKIVDL